VPIQSLVDKRDVSEIVRDEIAAILLAETTSQQALALAALPTPKDPDLWRLRIYTERTNPWEDFSANPDEASAGADGAPIVNVAFDNSRTDKAGSNGHERQKTIGTYHIDCYGYGISADNGSGHVAGDARAALECQRAVRLVRNWLMASIYTLLNMKGVVWSRWHEGTQTFLPQLNGGTVQHVVAARFTLEVTFSEFSPQYEPELLELISVTVKRAETGQIFFTADFDGT
jgi:hypothetical protein